MLTQEENELLTRTGPGTPMGELFRRFWMPALLSSELPAPDCPPVRLRLLGEDLVAFRATDGTVGLLDARCPHRRADLFFGRNEEQGLRCVYHGWKFDVAGICVDMPNEPAESNFKHKISTAAYPCIEQGGIVWAYMGPPERRPALPDLEWTAVEHDRRYVHKRLEECNYLQGLEGELDNSHASFLHGVQSPRLGAGQLLGGSAYASRDRAPKAVVKDTDYGMMVAWRSNAEEDSYYWRVTQYLVPCYAMIANTPDRPFLCFALVPRDDETAWAFSIAWRPDRSLSVAEVADIETWTGPFPELIPGTFRPVNNKDNDFNIDRALQRSYSYTGIRGIRDQDRAVQESQGVIMDRSQEHLGTVDAGIIGMRRRLAALVKDLESGIEPQAAHRGEVYRVRSVALVLKHGVPIDEAGQEYLTVQG
jgi:phthalate 4,5-dioxygenase oxygenase subunit